MFTVNVASLQAGAAVAAVLFLNADLNGDTGQPGSLRADYLFAVEVQASSYAFARWNGSAWDFDAPSTTTAAATSSTAIRMSVNRSDLGGASSFAFWVRTGTGAGGPGEFDDAPDDASWSYSLAAGGPDIQGVLASTTPARGPRAGRPFTVKPGGLQLPALGDAIRLLPSPDGYRCSAKLAGRRLAGSGIGSCTFNVPKAARGKRLVVSLTVTYQGATKTVALTYTVAR